MSYRRTLPFLAALFALYASLPAAAQKSIQPSPTALVIYRWHPIPLQHTVSTDIVKLMHWEPVATSPNPHLPPGVRRVFALQSNNSLLIEATDEGFAQIKQIVENLDDAQRQVEMKVEFITPRVADVNNLGIAFDMIPFTVPVSVPSEGPASAGPKSSTMYLEVISGQIAEQLYQTLVRTRSKSVQTPPATTTGNVPIIVINNSTLALLDKVLIIPHINPNDSITLDIQPQLPREATIPNRSDQSPSPAIDQRTPFILKTLKRGETIAICGPVTLEALNHPVTPLVLSLNQINDKPIGKQETAIFITPFIVGERDASPPVKATP